METTAVEGEEMSLKLGICEASVHITRASCTKPLWELRHRFSLLELTTKSICKQNDDLLGSELTREGLAAGDSTPTLLFRGKYQF